MPANIVSSRIPFTQACLALFAVLQASACQTAMPSLPTIEPNLTREENPTTASMEAPIHLRVSILNFTSFGPLFVAKEEGYFSDYGLDVEYIKFDNGTDMILALEQGQIDVAPTGPSIGLFNAMAQNRTLRVVGDKGFLDAKGCDYLALLAPPDWIAANPTPTAESFRGRKISIDSWNFEAFMFEKYLEPIGLTLEDLNAESIPSPSLLDAANNRSVDFISIGDPWITRITDGGAMAIWKPYQKIVPDMQFGLIVFGKSLVQDNPEAGKKFMTAYIKAIRQYNEGKTDRNLEIMADHTRLDIDLLRRACWPPMQNDGSVNLATVLDFQDWAIRKGLLEKGVSVEEMWDPRFVDAANAALE